MNVQTVPGYRVAALQKKSTVFSGVLLLFGYTIDWLENRREKGRG